MKNKENWLVTTSELSEILGVTDRRIRQLVKEGAVSRIDHGKFDLPKTIQQYIAWIGMKKEQKNEQTNEYRREKSLLVRANRQKAELELKKIERDLHKAEDVRQVMNHMNGVFRARCLKIPQNVAPKIVGNKELPIVQEIIKKEVYEALTELSNYDPDLIDRDENTEDTSKNKSKRTGD